MYIGRWSRCVAPRFLSWLAVPSGKRWLDVGCGTGALSAAILDQCTPMSLIGIDPSEGFLVETRRRLAGRMEFHCGDAMKIPLSDSSVDVTVSGLVLNFVPNPLAALGE